MNGGQCVITTGVVVMLEWRVDNWDMIVVITTIGIMDIHSVMEWGTCG